MISRISITGLKDFLLCPRKIYFSNVLRIEKKKKSVRFAFGTAFHSGATPVWLGRKNAFALSWVGFRGDKSITYDDRLLGNWDGCMEKGRVMSKGLETFLHENDLEIVNGKRGLEIPGTKEIDKMTVSYRVDARAKVKRFPMIIGGVEKKISGSVIFDLKTAAQQYPIHAARRSIQLSGYSYLSEEPPDFAAFLIVTKAKSPKIQVVGVKVDQRLLKEFEETTKGAIAYLNTGVYPANRGDHCNYCDFYELCYGSKDGDKKKNVNKLFKRRSRSRP